ncbi:hypothetical protein KBC31_01210 [Candidatus Saccharibacteria bacterium]|jgi:hypothetical protein|nr:hypothetical protein [Candidatus Saccharibacteria bacterium]
MNPEIQINELVDVIISFDSNSGYDRKCFPRKMRFHNQEITFTEFAFRHPTTKGKRMIHVFDMSDGANNYRLEFDAESLQWQLISMIEGGSL